VEVQNKIREAALEAILAWRRGRPVALPNPDPDVLVRMLSWSMGEPVPADFSELIAFHVGLDNPVPEPAPEVPSPPDPSSFEVLVIGAGIAGLCAGFYLQHTGITFTIVEKDSSVGGTWRDNRYPGAGVDVPNHLYAFSFAPNDWSKYFALRDEIRDYLEEVTDRLSLRSLIRFNTAVRSLEYEPELQRWAVDLQLPDASTEVIHPNVVISAVGIFNPPKYPDIPGLESFAGPRFHTADWPEDVDLNGRRVALIGNGASAMQVGPAIQDRVAELTVFQRSPSWAAPFEQFKKAVPAPVRMLLREVPLYRDGIERVSRGCSTTAPTWPCRRTPSGSTPNAQ
jgi:4-hydroxyacetophenone monooxygenase